MSEETQNTFELLRAKATSVGAEIAMAMTINDVTFEVYRKLRPPFVSEANPVVEIKFCQLGIFLSKLGIAKKVTDEALELVRRHDEGKQQAGDPERAAELLNKLENIHG